MRKKSSPIPSAYVNMMPNPNATGLRSDERERRGGTGPVHGAATIPETSPIAG